MAEKKTAPERALKRRKIHGKRNDHITGDVHIYFNLNDPEDCCEEDEFDDEYEDDKENEIPGISVFVDGLPENIDREAVQAVIETACKLLDGLINKAAASHKGESDEGV